MEPTEKPYDTPFKKWKLWKKALFVIAIIILITAAIFIIFPSSAPTWLKQD